ncbi:MAG TPA: hypothetical protein VKB84_04560 [Candidatus Binataceae bacterium]|nr:hypothetical protein [Candidatus Binataceae bacterium]
MNADLELSPGGAPPTNVYGRGAGYGKLWIDTSVSPQHIRMCTVQPPGLCSTTYNAAQWADIGAIDQANGTINLSSGGGLASIPSSGVIDLGLYPQSLLQITGTATINSFGTTLPAGKTRVLIFQGSLTITNSPTAIAIPGGNNITTQAGGMALVTSQGNGLYSLLYQPQPMGAGQSSIPNNTVLGNVTGAPAVPIPLTQSQLAGLVPPAALIVPTNGALRTQSTAGFVNGQTVVDRAGFTNPGDGGGARYVYSSSACSLASGAGDNGSQVQASGGGCWLLDNKGCPSIKVYGGQGNNAADNSASFAAALNAYPNPCVYFPAGKYKLLSAVSYTFPGNPQALTIRGDGIDQTELTWPNAVSTALTINLIGQSNAVHVRDLTISSGQAGADTGLKVIQTITSPGPIIASGSGVQSDFTNLVLRGDDGYFEQAYHHITHFWNYGILLNGVSFVLFYNVYVEGLFHIPSGGGAFADATSGNGVLVQGASATVIPVVFNFTNCNFQGLANGILIGAYTQGVSVSQSNFTSNFSGIGLPAGASATGLDQLAITTSQFANLYDVNLESTFADVLISNNLFLGATPPTGSTKTSIFYNVPSNNLIIQGNSFRGTGSSVNSTAIALNGSGSADSGTTTVAGNSFTNFKNAVTFGAGTQNATLSGDNRFLGNATNYSGPAGAANNNIAGLGVSYATISAYANNGSGLVRITVGSTSNFVSGQTVLVTPTFSSVPTTLFTPIAVIDGTHMDLLNITASGGAAFPSGSLVSSTP